MQLLLPYLSSFSSFSGTMGTVNFCSIFVVICRKCIFGQSLCDHYIFFYFYFLLFLYIFSNFRKKYFFIVSAWFTAAAFVVFHSSKIENEKSFSPVKCSFSPVKCSFFTLCVVCFFGRRFPYQWAFLKVTCL